AAKEAVDFVVIIERNPGGREANLDHSVGKRGDVDPRLLSECEIGLGRLQAGDRREDGLRYQGTSKHGFLLSWIRRLRMAEAPTSGGRFPPRMRYCPTTKIRRFPLLPASTT